MSPLRLGVRRLVSFVLMHKRATELLLVPCKRVAGRCHGHYPSISKHGPDGGLTVLDTKWLRSYAPRYYRMIIIILYR